ncbi:hypothetical protein IPJ70_00475 [Candidatus Campbellbacteria bacterium]|nr:MAG: hypothetical protein IPJ70_00475 [Candidatus Campbellbacteria bacterium]
MKKTTTNKVAVGTGIAALAAAAAGTYFFYASKDAKKNRAVVKAWSVKAKKDVVAELKQASAISEKGYHTTIKEVAERYKKLQKLDPKDVQAFVTELKGHWKNISKELKVATKKPVAKKKPAKKTTKK